MGLDFALSLICQKQVCSTRIFTPINTSTTPPVNSAFDLYRLPKTLPILIPSADRIKVVMPITATDIHRSTCKNAKDTPTAKASMLVAIASISITLKEKSSL